MKTYRVAAIPGDGIGNEVIPAGIEVLEKLQDGFRLEFEHFDWSSKRFQQTGRYIPEGGLQKLKAFDAIFFGAVGAPDVPDHLSLWGLRLPICQGFDQYANVRPARVLPGIKSPLDKGGAIDWVIVMTAALLALYQVMPGRGRMAATDAILITTPPPRLRSTGSACTAM